MSYICKYSYYTYYYLDMILYKLVDVVHIPNVLVNRIFGTNSEFLVFKTTPGIGIIWGTLTSPGDVTLRKKSSRRSVT